ncbi:galectin-3-like [Salmo trutta]|uniref:galectin-3-like n=1 Tax=Salmo trutta TaxID=8032 RepID=UPI0011322052|nr:galectin-3-like [Salmo trutta]
MLAWTPSSALNPGSGWPFSPGQSGWPGQNPGLNPGLNRGGSGWPFSPGRDPGGFKPASQWNPTQTGHLNVPYNLNLQRGLYDKMMLTIMGQVKPNAKQFTVNFLRGNDIAFHLNSRFKEGGKQAVVRNHKVGERWGKEERYTHGGFPFMNGRSFEMKILIMFEEFKVAVNGAQLFEFKHRVRELNQIDRINILHDVIIISVNVDTIP